ncbi:hypothetical protein EVAR_89472_1 [Eumeta japonica]|uniref:Uncharacterized protein n=1 Tax=Eumeta variegata TaxID=151549 RepID=A0A4C1XLV7_EUMVA|nr:hypothetical protein EVAR_89472_1 [Eumeta japonica]
MIIIQIPVFPSLCYDSRPFGSSDYCLVRSKVAIDLSKSEYIARIGEKLMCYPLVSHIFWFLTKAVQRIFCQQSFPPLRRVGGSLIYNSNKKADLSSTLIRLKSTLDDVGTEPQPIV